MKQSTQRHRKRRQQRALDRLRSKMEVEQSDKDTKRISKEISILEEKLKYSS